MRFVHTMRGFVRLGLRDQVRFTAAWFLLGFARLLIILLPFTAVRRLLGEDRTGAGQRPAPALEPEQLVRAAHIGRIVEAAAAHAPWRSDCYPQALTARTFLALRRIPHVVSFGVRRDGDALVAHAWVHAGDVAVTGGNGREYTEVGAFSWSPRSARQRDRA
ncbi:lasso peptide biosynthesis B2 protein [Nocardioides marmoriginsengisoli]|uniref:Lasso peptide biosynthesis B2 protein n=1 Tax=Nocardioides marmoriginsengisoli TaxID=661483 RepID=A0A3N0CIG6_9ACTN|nr:lasso peptide biosynthesis B2 protein [Nocardioides marmoriginsengisoli]RNL63230.1 lasso peptide biosynthesis B2 protein [Nocardioides marmoriginsengisoli]